MPLNVDQLIALHELKRLRLATTVGAQGFVDIDGDPDRLVIELLRLAKKGARLEAVQLGLIEGGRA